MNRFPHGTASIPVELRPHGAEWFLALPDDEAGLGISAALPPTACRVDHPSERPWLIGRWDARDMRGASAGRILGAGLGARTAEAAAHQRTAAKSHAVTNSAAASARIPGSFHLLASVDGTAYLQGT